MAIVFAADCALQVLEGVQRIDARQLDVVAATDRSPDQRVEQCQRDDLADQGDAENPGRDVHVEVGQDADQHDHEQRRVHPVDVIPYWAV